MLTKSLIAFAILTVPFAVTAQVLFEDGFNYTAGNTLGGSVNPGNSAAWEPGNPNMTIGNGNLAYSGLADIGAGSANNNELSLAWAAGDAGSATNAFTAVTSGQIYYSFLLDVTTLPGANDFVTALNPGSAAPNGGTDAIDAYVYSTGKIGLRTAGEATVTGATLSLNTTYLVVLEYNFATTTASLYLDPTLGAGQPTASLTLAGSGTVTSIDNVGFKNQATTGDLLIDNVIVGQNWSDVTPAPEPSDMALAGMGVVALGYLVRRLRR